MLVQPLAKGTLNIPKQLFDAVNGHLDAVFPEEGCGFLVGTPGEVLEFHPVENILHSPVAYQMRPDQLISVFFDAEERNLTPLAIVHSHPHTAPIPSVTDLKEATWTELIYIIVSLANRPRPEWRCWQIKDKHFQEIGFEVRNQQ